MHVSFFSLIHFKVSHSMRSDAFISTKRGGLWRKKGRGEKFRKTPEKKKIYHMSATFSSSKAITCITITGTITQFALMMLLIYYNDHSINQQLSLDQITRNGIKLDEIMKQRMIPEEQRLFFVYGSLRPDDITDQPWRNEWLEHGSVSPGTIVNARMFDDVFACVETAYNTDSTIHGKVHGYLVSFPAHLYLSKLKLGDQIEGTPYLYTRELIRARVGDTGVEVNAWVYTGVHCEKEKPITSGNWLTYQQNILKEHQQQKDQSSKKQMQLSWIAQKHQKEV